MNTRLARISEAQRAQPDSMGRCLREDVSAVARSLDGTVWLDLTLLNRTALPSVLAQYGLPLEVTTYFLLCYRSPKLIHVGSTLFLVTFLTAPSLRHLFLARELKICVTPTLVATTCGPRRRTQSSMNRLLTLSLSSRAGSSVRFLQQLFKGVLSSYEEVVKTLTKPDVDRVAEKAWGRHRIERFVHLLREQQALVNGLIRDGRKVLPDEEHVGFIQVEQRIEQLARMAWEIGRQTPPSRLHA